MASVPRKSPVKKAKSPKKSPKKVKQSPRKSPTKRVLSVKKVKLSPSERKNRQAPVSHAREYKVSTKMHGVDGHLWVVKNVTRKDGTKYKRWFKV